jgi:hypothetical protein
MRSTRLVMRRLLKVHVPIWAQRTTLTTTSLYVIATDDLAIADAIHEVESELKQKDKKSLFNPTTVVMLVIAGGIVTSRIASMFFSH